MKILALLFLGAGLGAARPWPSGASCAVSLTYDDGAATHVTNALPALNAAGLKATFFPTGRNSHAAYNAGAWSAISSAGHELGSHTMDHPCAKSIGLAGAPNEQYDMARMDKELLESVGFLRSLGEKRPLLSFAFPCGTDYVGEDRQPYLPLVQKSFAFSRAAWGGMANPVNVDLWKVPSVGADSLAPDGMVALVRKARAEKAWLVLMFHGVGGDHLSVSLPEHAKLLQFLAKNKRTVWTAPFGEVALRVRDFQGKMK